MDVYDLDRTRILGPALPAEIAQRARANLELQAAQQIAAEQRAAAQRAAEARAAEAQMKAAADAEAVKRLAVQQHPYAQRDEELAPRAIEAIAPLYRQDVEIKDGLNEAYQPLRQVEALIEPSARPAWFEGLRVMGGIPAKHIYTPRGVALDSDAKRVGATVVAAISAGLIGPGWIQVGSSIVHFDV